MEKPQYPVVNEGLMDSAAKRRAQDTHLIGITGASKADTVELLVTKERMATKPHEGQLHAECAWLLQCYDLRMATREEESEARCGA